MSRAFALYGKVVEVVIPPKRNRWGKRFGFIRFEDIKEPMIFAVKLNNIIFGADKIHVNLPRFKRDKNVERKNIATTVGRRRVWKEVVKEVKEGRDGGVVAEEKKTVPKAQEYDNRNAANRRELAQKQVERNFHNARWEPKGFVPKRFNNGRWREKQNFNEQRVVYYRKKNS